METGCQADFNLRADPPFCSPSCLHEVDRVLADHTSALFREACERFVDKHSNYRSLADFLIGAFVPELKPVLENFYSGEGKELVNFCSKSVIRKLDEVIAGLVALLAREYRPSDSDENYEALTELCQQVGARIWDFPYA